MEQTDVVVVGAGPVGLSLALGLAKSGIKVVVLEKNPSTAEHSRAPAIWPRTQEILAGIGVIERFTEDGIIVPTLEMYDADHDRVLLRIPLGELSDETPYPHLLVVPQSRTEKLLADSIAGEDTAEVRFSSELDDVIQDAEGVEVRYSRNGANERVRARFVAGCDGAHSRVREILGASFDGITYDVHVALADVTPRESENLPFPRFTTKPKLAIGIRIRRDLWRLILPFTTNDPRTPDQRIHDAVRNLFPTAGYETVWKSDFKLHRRVSSRWADGRIVLAGDAAHLNSPVGGQGMNAGIIDGALLRKELLEALGRDDPSPLARYASDRRSAVEKGVNRFTDRLTRILLAGHGRLLRPAMLVANTLIRIGPLRRRLLRNVAMLERR